MTASKIVRMSAASMAAILLACPSPASAFSGDALRPRSRVVCRDIVPTGTMLRKSMICMSEAAWNKPVGDREDDDDYSRESLQLKIPANPDALQIGTANWDRLPRLDAKGRLPYLQLVSEVRDALRKKSCTLPGQSAKSFDVTVRYGILLEPNGKARRILVQDSGCAIVNALVGLSAMARSDRGDFAPTRDAAARWYADSMNFTLQ